MRKTTLPNNLSAMTLSNLNRLPIELINLDHSFPFAFVILGLFTQVLYIFLGWNSKIYSFLLGSKPSPTRKQETQLKNQETPFKNQETPSKKLCEGSKEKHQDDGSVFIQREEVEIVLKRLGLFWASEPRGAKIEERLSCNDLCSLFQEKEASLDEVKAAFDVFDDNRDGFIDAVELQRLLCTLGLEEGLEIHNCMRMIKVADDDGDGMIDFKEFAKFMENSIS